MKGTRMSRLAIFRGLSSALIVPALLLSCSDNTTFQGSTRSDLVQGSDATPYTSQTPDPLNAEPGTLPRSISRKPDSLLAQFPASIVRETKVPFTLNVKNMDTTFTLEDIQKTQAEAKDQNTRTPATQNFKQGTPGTLKNESIPQVARKGLVDILVVVDNSGSMKEEQTNLSDKLNELLVSLGNTQWQIGVINTSPVIENNAAKCVLSLIRYTDADAMNKFKTAVMVGTSGNSSEQGIRQAVVGLGCANSPWLRPTSTVAVLIVSDEDNCSKDGGDCGTELWAKESYLINYVEGTLGKTIGKDAGFFGIFSPPSMPCKTAPNIGAQYQRLVDYKANGQKNYGNICDASYKDTLNRISDSIALLLNNQFELQDTPSSGSLSLKLRLANGTESNLAAGDYTVTGKVISFGAGKEPPVGSTILASYRVGAVPEFKSVTLNQDPAPDTVSVTVDGNQLAAGAYSLSNRTITFANQPASLANITVGYRLNTPLISTFKLAQSPLAGTLAVTVDGAAAAPGSYSYDAAQNQVVFAKAPSDGARVAFAYKYREGPLLSYKPMVATDGQNFKLMDGNKNINFQKVGDTFTIAAADHQPGKSLKLSYEVPDRSTRTFALGHKPLADSLVLTSSVPQCKIGQGIEIQEDKLLTSCAVTAEAKFTLEFKYIDIQTEFSLDGIADPEKGTWQVFVNGSATQDFTRKGSKITLSFEPELDAKITISYSLPEQ